MTFSPPLANVQCPDFRPALPPTQSLLGKPLCLLNHPTGISPLCPALSCLPAAVGGGSKLSGYRPSWDGTSSTAYRWEDTHSAPMGATICPSPNASPARLEVCSWSRLLPQIPTAFPVLHSRAGHVRKLPLPRSKFFRRAFHLPQDGP